MICQVVAYVQVFNLSILIELLKNVLCKQKASYTLPVRLQQSPRFKLAFSDLSMMAQVDGDFNSIIV